MKIDMQFGSDADGVNLLQYDYSFVGKALDDRGKESISFIQNNSGILLEVNYHPQEFLFEISGTSHNIDDLYEVLPDFSKKLVLLDATTLGFVETLLICQHLYEQGNNCFDILYVEPENYNRKKHEQTLNKRDFELSQEIIGYEAIPGHALTIDSEYDQQVVFLCGYEAERMDRALEDSELLGERCKCIFGLPAFRAGWEMDSFANNIRVIKERRMRRDIEYCGASNPLSVYDKLENIYKGLADDSQLFIVPLSTKPMSIGACLFLLNKPKEKVAVLYDHPLKKEGRGIKVGKWHLYKIKI